MARLSLKILFLFVLLILLSIQGSTNLEQQNQIQPNQRQLKNEELSPSLKLNPDFGKIPLYFVPNQGQVDETALFYAKTSRYTLWLTKEGLVFDRRLSPRDMDEPEDVAYERDVSRLVFLNANRNPEVIPKDDTEHKVNYFIGSDESKWQTNIQTSRAVLYKELYPNIDLKVYGVEKQIEYDFVVKPGGEVSDIRFEYKEVEKTRIDKDGSLIIKTKFGEIKHAKPVCYQVIRGERVEIQAEFMKIGDNNYGFKVKGYNRNYELVIDPVVLVYSTYLGGSGNENGFGIAVDSEGAAYVTGDTESNDFPTKSPFQGTKAGSMNAFIAKVDSSGSALIYSTYLGGSLEDSGFGIAVDSEGAAYVTGRTSSIDFPTQNPIQETNAGCLDTFITKVNASGSALIYSTYLGGFEYDPGYGIAVDSEGAAYVIGWTFSSDFPTQNPIQGSFGGGDYGEYDAFIAKVNSSGSALIYSTYLGGSDDDKGRGIAVDSEGTAYLTGQTSSTNFPVMNPFQKNYAGGEDVFIAKLASFEGIRIVSWNILDYPDSNEEPREEYFRSILKILNPDVLVVQEMASAAGVDQFLNEVLNHETPRLYKAASFFDGPDTDNALFYKRAMIKIISRQQIPTSFRDITEYKIKIKKGAGKGTEFKVYSVHFTEGAGAKKERENEASTLRTYLDGLLPDELFLVCGSFNMMSSTEKAFNILTGNQVNNNGRLMDPIHKIGKWHDKSEHRAIHTESTRKSEFGGGKGGGLDDRYDMILISYGLDQDGKLIYRPGSCVVCGNDGKHFNKAINKPKNKIVCPDIADALYKASDHLPVIIDLVPQDESSVNEIPN